MSKSSPSRKGPAAAPRDRRRPDRGPGRPVDGREAPRPTGPAARSSLEPSTLDDLTPDPANRRTHPARNLDMLAASLATVGAARSIVIDEDGGILAGNGVVEAAKRAGLSKVQIVDAPGDTIVAVRRIGLSSEAKRALALFDNRAAELSTWNTDQLAADVADGLALTPFWSADEQKALFAPPPRRGRVDPENTPPRRATSIVEGDVLVLGRHRLVCGDSTRIDVVGRALDGVQPELVFTDPPYGVNVTGKGGDAIAGDITFTAIPLMFDVLDQVLAPQAWCYVCGGQSNAPLYARLMERYFRQLPRIIVWDKGATAVLRRGGYHSCYEFIYYTFREGGGGRWFGPRDSEHADDIWRQRVEHGAERVHLTQKPVALPLRAITNSCPPDGVILDPFGGSGSTLIAAEQAGRACVVLELDPVYCQVIVDRWEAFAGSKALKVGGTS